MPVEEGNIPAGVLFGNRNYNLFAEAGKLVEDYYDTSDREHPLVIRYSWDGRRFRETSRAAPTPFQPSYDCSKATQETEQAICASEKLAGLDVQLHAVYLERLRSASAQDQIALKQEQRNWLKRRNSACSIYKGWIECLADLYQKRIADLRRK